MLLPHLLSPTCDAEQSQNVQWKHCRTARQLLRLNVYCCTQTTKFKSSSSPSSASVVPKALPAGKKLPADVWTVTLRSVTWSMKKKEFVSWQLFTQFWLLFVLYIPSCYHPCENTSHFSNILSIICDTICGIWMQTPTVYVSHIFFIHDKPRLAALGAKRAYAKSTLPAWHQFHQTQDVSLVDLRWVRVSLWQI